MNQELAQLLDAIAREEAQKVPAIVTQDVARDAYIVASSLRRILKLVAAEADALRDSLIEWPVPYVPKQKGEAIANATLTLRHLEDASMRLGKTLQALDGGVSVYDRATTVGA